MFGSAFSMLTRYEEAVLPRARPLRSVPRAARRSPHARASSTSRSSTPTSSCSGRRCSGCGRGWRRPRSRTTGCCCPTTSTTRCRPSAGAGRLLARQLAGDVVRRRDLGLAGRAGARARRCSARPSTDRDPHNTFDFLMTVSERARAAQRLLLPVATTTGYPRGGRVRPRRPPLGRAADAPGARARPRGRLPRRLRHLPRSAADRGGVRRGCAAYAEREGVRQERWGGRQHYLQWANPTTWRNWDEAGLDYDCTLAFSEAVGFRTGTCHEYPVFDLVAGTPLGLRERPFQVMDVTLFGYMGLGRTAATRRRGPIAPSAGASAATSACCGTTTRYCGPRDSSAGTPSSSSS